MEKFDGYVFVDSRGNLMSRLPTYFILVLLWIAGLAQLVASL